MQEDVEAQWLERRPQLSQADLLRAWWRWITASPQNLAVVRLGIEAAALDATVTGLPRPGARRSDRYLARRTSSSACSTRACHADGTIEASLAKAMFTGLVVDLLATGQKARLTRALEVGLTRLEQVVWASAGLSDPAIPASTRHRDGRNPAIS